MTVSYLQKLFNRSEILLHAHVVAWMRPQSVFGLEVAFHLQIWLEILFHLSCIDAVTFFVARLMVRLCFLYGLTSKLSFAHGFAVKTLFTVWRVRRIYSDDLTKLDLKSNDIFRSTHKLIVLAMLENIFVFNYLIRATLAVKNFCRSMLCTDCESSGIFFCEKNVSTTNNLCQFLSTDA